MLNKFNRTRGNNLKFKKKDLNMISAKPHSVSEYPIPGKIFLIVNSKDVNQFKINLDNYWSKYDIL